jgi:flagellar motor switch protein FliG
MIAPMQVNSAENLTGSLKAAILVQAMGEHAASRLMNSLTDAERDVISGHLSRLESISPDVIDQVAREFALRLKQAKNRNAALPGVGPQGKGQAGSEEKKGDALDAIVNLPPDEIYELIKDEHPQTMAIILIHLKTSAASDVLSMLPDEIKTEVALRISSLDKVISSMVEEVNHVFEEILKNKKGAVTNMSGGVDRLAEILNNADEISSELILNEIEEADADLAAQIKQKMFVFEDLVLVDDRGFQKLLRKVETTELAIALKAASEEVKEKVFRNMSTRAADMLQEEMEDLGPVRMKEVSDSQQSITNIIQEMEAKGEVIISGRRGEEIIT